MLIREFGSLPELLAAPSERLRRVGGGERAIAAIAAARLVVRRSVTAGLESRPVMTRATDFQQYLRAHVGYERVETVRVLYLDAARRLIADEQAGRGRPDEAPFYVRTILGRALELSATGIVVAHNHPSGVLSPSRADRLVTNHLLRAAEVVGIVLLDHVIVTRRGCRSIVTDVGALAAEDGATPLSRSCGANPIVRSPSSGDACTGGKDVVSAQAGPPRSGRRGRQRRRDSHAEVSSRLSSASDRPSGELDGDLLATINFRDFRRIAGGLRRCWSDPICTVGALPS